MLLLLFLNVPELLFVVLHLCIFSCAASITENMYLAGPLKVPAESFSCSLTALTVSYPASTTSSQDWIITSFYLYSFFSIPSSCAILKVSHHWHWRSYSALLKCIAGKMCETEHLRPSFVVLKTYRSIIDVPASSFIEPIKKNVLRE